MSRTFTSTPNRPVAPGDVIEFLGTQHVIATVEPYTHPEVTGGELWSIARDAKGWGITIAHPPAA